MTRRQDWPTVAYPAITSTFLLVVDYYLESWLWQLAGHGGFGQELIAAIGFLFFGVVLFIATAFALVWLWAATMDCLKV